MKILFLDIDGCLNTHDVPPGVLCGQFHADKVARLNAVLRATGCRVVLSSAWRYLVLRGEMNLRGLEWLLRSHGVLADRLVGITRPDTMERAVYDGKPGTWPQHNERGRQIADWLAVSVGMIGVPVDRHAVLDDLDLGITEHGHPFVRVDGTVGLTDADAGRLIELLGRA